MRGIGCGICLYYIFQLQPADVAATAINRSAHVRTRVRCQTWWPRAGAVKRKTKHHNHKSVRLFGKVTFYLPVFGIIVYNIV